jgi:hypothetical protein
MAKKKRIDHETQQYTRGIVELVQRHSTRSERLDANETAFLERQLTQLRTKQLEVLYGAVKGLQLVPIANDIDPNVDVYTYQIFEKTGVANIGGMKSTERSRVEVGSSEGTGKVYPVETSYGWTIHEMRNAARLRIPLPELKMRAARSAIELGIDDMIIQGRPASASTAVTTTGIANAPGVVTHGTDFTNWVAGGSPTDDDVVIGEMTEFIEAQQTSVKENEKLLGNTLILPYNRYSYLRSKRLGVDSTETVLGFLKKTYTEIQFTSWHRLQSFATNGTKDLAIMYRRDPDCLEAVVPNPYEELPPQFEGYETVINVFARCGGVKVYQPLSMRYRKFA